MYNLNLLDDTIAAISTPIGEGGIGIVRLSGRKALEIADKVFVSKDGKRPSQFETYTTHYGYVVDQSTSRAVIQSKHRDPKTPRPQDRQAEIIDEVILTVMRAPKSYTKEDVVEINCHSGIVPLKRLLDLATRLGARLAQPGEFTMRAFVNGRIDLTQAEAVLDIVRARTETSLRVALNQLKGRLSKQIQRLGEMLLEVLTSIEASIDFPEEDIEVQDKKTLSKRIAKVSKSLKELLKESEYGRVLREGMVTVICGRPNVGKSSLLNLLLKENRAIVTPIPGTTRDIIEEVVNIKGVPLRIVDTAGIIEPKDLIEQEGVRKSRLYLRRADLVLLVLDGSQPLSEEDGYIMEQVKDKQKIPIINKIDLPQRISLKGLKSELDGEFIRLSATQGRGLSSLEEAIVKEVWKGKVTSTPEALVSNIRHQSALRRAYGAIANAQKAFQDALPIELIAFELKEALNCLGEITGQVTTEDLLERIFSEFCIGK